MTQKELAEKSMVSLSTIKRFENNEEISLTKLVQLLMALDLINNLDMLIPDQSSRPSSYAADYKAKQRVRKKSEKEKTWKWGDEE